MDGFIIKFAFPLTLTFFTLVAFSVLFWLNTKGGKKWLENLG